MTNKGRVATRVARVLVLALAFASALPSVALADSGSKPSANPTPTAQPLKPGTTWLFGAANKPNTGMTPSSTFPGGSSGVTCSGVSWGGLNGGTSIWGTAYQSCAGAVVQQTMYLHAIYCVDTWLGACFPAWDLGVIASRTFAGAGGFWVPESGSATMGGLTCGRTYMIHTDHYVYAVSGTGSGGSNSSMFYMSC